MGRTTTGWFRPKKRKRPSFMTVMVCPDATCNHVWEASCTSSPCPRCGSGNAVLASAWDLDEKEALKLGRLPAVPARKGEPHGK